MINTMFGKRSTPRIPQQSTLPGYVFWLIALILVILIGLAAVYWPANNAITPESKMDLLQQEVERQSEVIESLTKDKEALLQRIAKQQQLSQIDREAQSRVQDELKKYQDERLKMEEELVFLRSMVSSRSGSSVLRLQRLRLLPGKDENSFLYSFTVSKVLKDSEYVEGAVFLTLTGELDGKKRILPLKKLTVDKEDSLKMRFKHFQNIEGELFLPSRFVPSSVTIEVKPNGRKYAPVKKSFEWVVIG